MKHVPNYLFDIHKLIRKTRVFDTRKKTETTKALAYKFAHNELQKPVKVLEKI